MLSLTLPLNAEVANIIPTSDLSGSKQPLREPIECCLSVSPLCWTSLGVLRLAALNALLHSSMCGTGALQTLSEALHLMNCGMRESLTSLTFECGGALHMCMCRRTKDPALDRTWRSVYSLAILRDTRAGSSTTQPPRRQELLRELTLMRDISPSRSVHLLPLFPSLVQQLRILLLYSPP